MRSPWKRRLLVIGCWLALAVAGCGTGESVRVTHTDPPVLVNQLTGGVDALITGWFRWLDEGPCLVVEHEMEGQSLIVWPRGSRPVFRDGEFVGVHVPGHGQVDVGDWVIGGGGYHSIDGLEPSARAVADACPADVTDFVRLWQVNSDD